MMNVCTFKNRICAVWKRAKETPERKLKIILSLSGVLCGSSSSSDGIWYICFSSAGREQYSCGSVAVTKKNVLLHQRKWSLVPFEMHSFAYDGNDGQHAAADEGDYVDERKNRHSPMSHSVQCNQLKRVEFFRHCKYSTLKSAPQDNFLQGNP